MSKLFTLAEAERLLPELESALRAACEHKAEHQVTDAELQGVTQRIMFEGGVRINREHLLDVKARRDSSAGKLKESMETIQSHGCVVKDLDMGLLDFPTLFHGQEVYLCWKLGETSIEYWHGITEGFRLRKKIDQDFIDNHQGQRAH